MYVYVGEQIEITHTHAHTRTLATTVAFSTLAFVCQQEARAGAVLSPLDIGPFALSVNKTQRKWAKTAENCLNKFT